MGRESNKGFEANKYGITDVIDNTKPIQTNNVQRKVLNELVNVIVFNVLVEFISYFF